MMYMSKNSEKKSTNKYKYKSKGKRQSLLVTILPLIFCVISVSVFVFVVFADKHTNDKESEWASRGGDSSYSIEPVTPKGVDISTLKKVDENQAYFYDEANVYFEDKLLPIKPSEKLKVVSAEQGEYFLYDGKSGEVFCGQYRFDEKSAPYTVIGNKSSHIYNLLFISKDGAYIYNQLKKKQVRIGKNVFKGKLEQLTNSVFRDDENIYFLRAQKSYWIKSRLRFANHIRNYFYSWDTYVVYLDKNIGWKKLQDLGEGSGSIWEKNGSYYYFDELGNSQGVGDTVFEIRDELALKELTNSSNALDGDRITKMLEQKKLKVVSGETLLKARVRYRGHILIIMCLLPLIFALNAYTLHRRLKYGLKT